MTQMVFQFSEYLYYYTLILEIKEKLENWKWKWKSVADLEQHAGGSAVESEVAKGNGASTTKLAILRLQVIDKKVHCTGGNHSVRNSGPRMGQRRKVTGCKEEEKEEKK